jgi:hypothetical protein
MDKKINKKTVEAFLLRLEFGTLPVPTLASCLLSVNPNPSPPPIAAQRRAVFSMSAKR